MILVLAAVVVAAPVLILYSGWGTNGDSTLFYLLGIPALGGIAALLTLLQSVRKTRNLGRAVLYCRRFAGSGRARARNRWFETVLVEACRGLAVPITLQDESIPAPAALSAGIRGLAWVIGVLLWLLLTVLMLFMLRPWTAQAPAAVLISAPAIALLLALLLAPAARHWLRISIGSQRARDFAPIFRQTVTRGSSRLNLHVVRSTAADWQADVERILGDVTYAVVDVTSSTENLNWECRRSLELVGPDNVLFVSDTAGHRGIERVPSWVPGFAGDLPVMRLPREIPATAIADNTRQSYVEILRNWLLHRRGTTDEAIRAGYRRYDRAFATARRRASGTYALLSACLGFLVSAGESGHPTTMAAFVTASLAGAFAYLTAYGLLARARFRTTPFQAMRRGAGIVLITFWSTYMVSSAIVDGLQLRPDPGTEMPAAVFAVVAVAMSISLAIAGAIIGAAVEAVFLRTPSPGASPATRR